MRFVFLLWSLVGTPVLAQMKLPAITTCVKDTAAITVRKDLVKDTRTYQELLAHEVVHKQQLEQAMKLGQPCKDALKQLTKTPIDNLRAEVPAYRAQAEWLRRNHLQFDETVFYETVARGLYFWYSGMIAYSRIERWLRTGNDPGP